MPERERSIGSAIRVPIPPNDTQLANDDTVVIRIVETMNLVIGPT